ncbi:MAG: dienelactone hydrolase family protein [Verrucomicrobiota bacterium]|nr:dienelactone hydrolase family protein [Verrucomicrobiota bacterium]
MSFRFCCAFLFLVLGSFASAREQEVRTSSAVLQLPHGRITAEVFEGARGEKRPAILVLHGAGGTLFDGPEMRRVARHLAAAGNSVYVVHYFERTGSIFALDSTMQKNFATWLETVRESIVAIQTMRGNKAKVGIYGYSLGGFLALAAASDNPRVGAVVEHAGGVWNNHFERIGRMPPVLMIHGEEDARVPVAKYTRPLIPVLRARSAKLETRFFPGEGHVFTQRAMLQVREAAVRFFRDALGSRR